MRFTFQRCFFICSVSLLLVSITVEGRVNGYIMFNSSSDSQDTEGSSGERGNKVRYESTNEVKFIDHVVVEKRLSVMKRNVLNQTYFVFPDLFGKYSVFCPTSYQIVRKIYLLGNKG